MEEGGETVFPNADTKVTGPEWSECAKKGLAVKTRKGDALLFFRWVLLSCGLSSMPLQSAHYSPKSLQLHWH